MVSRLMINLHEVANIGIFSNHTTHASTAYFEGNTVLELDTMGSDVEWRGLTTDYGQESCDHLPSH